MKNGKMRILMIIIATAALSGLTGCKNIIISARDASDKINECTDNLTRADILTGAEPDKKEALLNDVCIKLSNGNEDELAVNAKYYGGPNEAIVAEANFHESGTGRDMDMLIRYEDILRDNVPDRVYINISSNAPKGTVLFVENILDTAVSLLKMYSIDEETAVEFLQSFKSRKIKIAEGELGNMKWEYKSTAILPVVWHDYVLIITKK